MLPLLIHAGIDHQTIEPCRELRTAAKLHNPRHQFEKDLLCDIPCGRFITFEVVERDGIDLFLISLKEQSKGIPVSTLTGIYDALRYLLLARHSALLHPSAASVYSLLKL